MSAKGVVGRSSVMESLFDFALFCDDDDSMSDFEDAVLFKLAFPKEKELRSRRYSRFKLEAIGDEECVSLFRFRKNDIERLVAALKLPATVQSAADRRCSTTGTEALCMLLRRLTYPNRLSDLERLFGMSGPFISNICPAAMSIILQKKKVLLTDLGALEFLNQRRLQSYAQAILEKGAPVGNCWGFIDGTAKAICRPSREQENFYSGHKRMHCLKYQSVMCPDGIVASLHGPFLGRRHDAAIFRESEIYTQLEKHAVFQNEKFCLYGDSAYPIRELLLKPFGSRGRTFQEEEFDKRMSKVRQAVEWGFGKIVNEFAFVDFRKKQKILLQHVRAFYSTATILTNCHTCLYASQVASYFDLQPPELEDYLKIRD